MVKAACPGQPFGKNPVSFLLHEGPGPAVVGRGKTVGGGTNLSRQSFN